MNLKTKWRDLRASPLGGDSMGIPWQKLAMTDARLERVSAEVSPAFHDLDCVCVCAFTRAHTH